jgi:hypothetical protein
MEQRPSNNALDATVIIKMDGDKTLTAGFARYDEEKFTVIFDGNNATTGSAPTEIKAVYNAKITLPDQGCLGRSGYRFDGWNENKTGTGTDYYANSSYTVTRGATLYARWIPVYAVIVSSAGTGASGSGDYAADDMVTIKAGTAPDGKQFKNWTSSDGVNFADASDAMTMFIMPAKAVTVTAVFEEKITSTTKYRVTVSSVGTGSSGTGDYAMGDTVTISAGAALAGQQFKNWTTTSASLIFVNANSATTKFKMPSNAVTVTANFKASGNTVNKGALADSRDGQNITR